jgi:hypothetical protein
MSSVDGKPAEQKDDADQRHDAELGVEQHQRRHRADEFAESGLRIL